MEEKTLQNGSRAVSDDELAKVSGGDNGTYFGVINIVEVDGKEVSPFDSDNK